MREQESDNLSQGEKLEWTVRTYFDACNQCDRDKFYRVLSDHAVHYFPPEVGGPYVGKEAIADLWISAVQKNAGWTIDRMLNNGKEVVIEWSHFKRLRGEVIRGAEWYAFDEDGKIAEIRAYYASPRDPDRKRNELEAFPYAERAIR